MVVSRGDDERHVLARSSDRRGEVIALPLELGSFLGSMPDHDREMNVVDMQNRAELGHRVAQVKIQVEIPRRKRRRIQVVHAAGADRSLDEITGQASRGPIGRDHDAAKMTAGRVARNVDAFRIESERFCVLVHPRHAGADLFRHRDEVLVRFAVSADGLRDVDEVEGDEVGSRVDEVLCHVPGAERRTGSPCSTVDEDHRGRVRRGGPIEIEALILTRAIRVPLRRQAVAEVGGHPCVARVRIRRVLLPAHLIVCRVDLRLRVLGAVRIGIDDGVSGLCVRELPGRPRAV